MVKEFLLSLKRNTNLAKLDDGLDESPTVMVEEDNNNKLGKNRGILKPSLAFIKNIKAQLGFRRDQ